MMDWLISKENSKECRIIGHKEPSLALGIDLNTKEKYPHTFPSWAGIQTSLDRVLPWLMCWQKIGSGGCWKSTPQGPGTLDLLWCNSAQGKVERAAGRWVLLALIYQCRCLRLDELLTLTELHAGESHVQCKSLPSELATIWEWNLLFPQYFL